MALGTALVVLQAAVCALSARFAYETPRAQRPILSFLLLEAASAAVYLAALKNARRTRLSTVLAVGLACRLLALASVPIQETDHYRYLWDGQQTLAGRNPYAKSPAEAAGLGLVPPEGRLVLERVNHPDVPTLYPPLAQTLFALGQVLTPWRDSGWRLLVFLAECATLAALISSLRLMRLPPQLVLAYAWCPLVIKEFSNSLHVDAFAALAVALAFRCAAGGTVVGAFLCLGLGALVKWYPLALAPILAAWAWNGRRLRVGLGAGLCAGLILAAFAPFASARVFDGLGRFALDWRVNDGAFGLLSAAAGRLSPGSPAAAELLARGTAAGLFAAVVLALTWRLRRGGPPDGLARGFLAAAAFLFFLSPAANPWYYAWLAVLLPFARGRSLAAFSGLAFLYYLDFHLRYRGQGPLFAWARAAEYGVFALLLLWEAGRKYLTAPSPSLSPGRPTMS